VNSRQLTRIHVHTLAYQAILTVKNSPWKNSKAATAKASLTANRHVCGSVEVSILRNVSMKFSNCYIYNSHHRIWNFRCTTWRHGWVVSTWFSPWGQLLWLRLLYAPPKVPPDEFCYHLHGVGHCTACSDSKCRIFSACSISELMNNLYITWEPTNLEGKSSLLYLAGEALPVAILPPAYLSRSLVHMNLFTMIKWYLLGIHHHCFFPHPFQFIIHSHHIV
jgi:hypothetical protein